MKPTNTKSIELALEELEEITPILDEVVDQAIVQARDFFVHRNEKVNSYLFPCLVRYFAKLLLESRKYVVAGFYVMNISNNGLFIIYLKAGGQTRKIRILKADEGELPTRNLSGTKKEFYNQPPPLFAMLPLGDDAVEVIAPPSVNYVAIWDVDKNFVFTGMNLLCPNGESGNVYFAHPIPHSVTTISATHSFDEVPDELEDIDIERLEKTGTRAKDGSDD